MFEKFADPVLIQQMTLSEKISVALFVTVLGMLITFAALVVLWGLTEFYSRIVRNVENKNSTKSNAGATQTQAPAQPVQSVTKGTDDDELVAVFAAAIAMATGRKPQNLVVRQIRQIVDVTPAWGQAGRVQQMNSRM